MAELVHILSATPLTGHTLELRFNDGSAGEVDLARHVPFTGIFAALADEAYFRQVLVDPELGTVVWPNGADLDPTQLRAWARKLPLDRVQEDHGSPWECIPRTALALDALESAHLLAQGLNDHPARWRQVSFTIRDSLGHLLSRTFTSATSYTHSEQDDIFDVRHGLATFSELIDHLSRDGILGTPIESDTHDALRSLDALCQRSIDHYPTEWSIDREETAACCRKALAFGQRLVRLRSDFVDAEVDEQIGVAIDRIIAALPVPYANTTKYGVS